MNCAVDDLLYRPSVSESHRKEKLATNGSRDPVASLLCRFSPRRTSATARRFVRHASTFSRVLQLR
jgi:hypothetical protein